jgi:hypothetical protein
MVPYGIILSRPLQALQDIFSMIFPYVPVRNNTLGRNLKTFSVKYPLLARWQMSEVFFSFFLFTAQAIGKISANGYKYFDSFHDTRH